MNRTTNYKLCQWERSDKVLMEDFNEDNAKIDGALAAVRDRVNTLTAGRPGRLPAGGPAQCDAHRQRPALRPFPDRLQLG